MKFKIGDKVRIAKNHQSYCNASHNRCINMIGIIVRIDDCKLPISVRFDDTTWNHEESCLEKVNIGFNPDEIISKAFGVTNA